METKTTPRPTGKIPSDHPLPWRQHPRDSAGQIVDAKGRDVIVNGRASDDSLRAFILRAVNAYPRLLAIVARIARNGECTCIDGGPGFTCDYCEARAVLAEAEAAKLGTS